MIFVLVLCLIILIIFLMAYVVLFNKNTICGGGYYKQNRHTFKNKFSNDPSGWQLYTLNPCGYCTKQKSALHGFNTYAEFERGNDVPIVNNIKGKLYPKEKIKGFPFWYNSKTGEKKSGVQNVCSLIPNLC
jgi:hypothetical protein